MFLPLLADQCFIHQLIRTICRRTSPISSLRVHAIFSAIKAWVCLSKYSNRDWMLLPSGNNKVANTRDHGCQAMPDRQPRQWFFSNGKQRKQVPKSPQLTASGDQKSPTDTWVEKTELCIQGHHESQGYKMAQKFGGKPYTLEGCRVFSNCPARSQLVHLVKDTWKELEGRAQRIWGISACAHQVCKC